MTAGWEENISTDNNLSWCPSMSFFVDVDQFKPGSDFEFDYRLRSMPLGATFRIIYIPFSNK